MAERVVVSGVGMVPFVATGSNASGIAERAIRNALDDAGIDVELVDQAVASHVHGDSAAGERAFARSGLTGIPVSNVSNGSASGSAALFHARQALLSGEAQCVLAVGFEETIESASPPPEARAALRRAARLACRADGNRRRDVRARRRQGSRARGAQSVRAPSRSAVARGSTRGAASRGAPSPLLCERGELRRCGGRPLHAALRSVARTAGRRAARGAVARERRFRQRGQPQRARRSRPAARRGVSPERAYQSAGVDPGDIDVAEVHDCCVGDELISCVALGLCAEDAIERFVRSGANTYGGAVVVSPSGGQLSTGNAPGATGSRRSASSLGSFAARRARARSHGARIGLQHNGGPGGAVAVAILRRSD